MLPKRPKPIKLKKPVLKIKERYTDSWTYSELGILDWILYQVCSGGIKNYKR
jgi:hypothetical protein